MLGPGNCEGFFERANCPLCGAAERTIVHARVEDRLLRHPGLFSICQCHACQVRYLDPRPVGETLVGYYRPNGDLVYPDNEPGRAKILPLTVRFVLHYDRGYPPPTGDPPSARGLAWARRRLARDPDCWRFLPWKGEGRLLDVGCGAGRYLATMAALGWRPEGVNFVPEVCQDIRQRLGFVCHQGDLLELDLPEGTYDAITLWHVLEHVTDPKAVVAQVRRLLRPGGLLGLGLPVYDCTEAELLGDAWLGYEVPRHLVTFSRARLRTFLEEAGFRLELLRSEARDRVLAISYARGQAPWWLKQIMRRGRLRRAYARRLARQDRIGTVVALVSRT